MSLTMLLLGMRLLASPNAGETSAAPACRSVADCWLDEEGRAIRRPARYRGRHLPRGDCGAHLRWLRHSLTCDEGVCTARDIGDRC